MTPREHTFATEDSAIALSTALATRSAPKTHGTGANMDNLETHDERRILPGSLFSVEPGIYLEDFGVRSEVNVFVTRDSASTTGAVQRDLVRIG